MSGDTRQVTLRLSRAGHRQLDTLLRQHRRLYNAALEERFTAWRTNRVSISYPQQSRELTLVRGDDPAWAGQDRRLAVETLKRADKAFGNWFRRIKAGQKGGRPRFRSEERFRTLEIYAGATKYLKVYGTGGAIEIKGLPALRFRMPRKPLPPGQPLVIRITRTPCRVTASLVYGMETPEPSAGQPAAPAGIDLGVANTITISTCAGGDSPRAGRTCGSGCRRSGGLPQGNNRARWGRCIQDSTRAPAGGVPPRGGRGFHHHNAVRPHRRSSTPEREVHAEAGTAVAAAHGQAARQGIAGGQGGVAPHEERQGQPVVALPEPPLRKDQGGAATAAGAPAAGDAQLAAPTDLADRQSPRFHRSRGPAGPEYDRVGGRSAGRPRPERRPEARSQPFHTGAGMGRHPGATGVQG